MELPGVDGICIWQKEHAFMYDTGLHETTGDEDDLKGLFLRDEGYSRVIGQRCRSNGWRFGKLERRIASRRALFLGLGVG